MARCSTCNAEIRWLEIVKSDGNRGTHPVDIERVTIRVVTLPKKHVQLQPGERWVVGYDDAGNMVRGVAAPDLPGSVAVHESHFATCPEAAQHRRSKR